MAQIFITLLSQGIYKIIRHISSQLILILPISSFTSSQYLANHQTKIDGLALNHPPNHHLWECCMSSSSSKSKQQPKYWLRSLKSQRPILTGARYGKFSGRGGGHILASFSSNQSAYRVTCHIRQSNIL